MNILNNEIIEMNNNENRDEEYIYKNKIYEINESLKNESVQNNSKDIINQNTDDNNIQSLNKERTDSSIDTDIGIINIQLHDKENKLGKEINLKKNRKK